MHDKVGDRDKAGHKVEDEVGHSGKQVSKVAKQNLAHTLGRREID